jgi:hypothetical protein
MASLPTLTRRESRRLDEEANSAKAAALVALAAELPAPDPAAT